MKSNPAGNCIYESENHRSDRAGIMNEPLALENILYVAADIGKGFREGYARCLLDNLVDGIIIFDESGKIQAFNPVAEGIFSYTPEEAQGSLIDTFIPKLSSTTYAQYIKYGNEMGEKQDSGLGKEVTGIRKNGFAVPLILLIKKIDFNGSYLFMAIIRKA